VLWTYSAKDGWPGGLTLYADRIEIGRFVIPVIKLHEVPSSEASTFLGIGFRCEIAHLNRLNELLTTDIVLGVREVELGMVTLSYPTDDARKPIVMGSVRVADDLAFWSSNAGIRLRSHLTAK
jgi:hypothetical protein